MDGASEWRIFWTVYRPLAQPMTAAFTVIAFLQNWNNFLFPLVVTPARDRLDDDFPGVADCSGICVHA